VSLDYIEQLFRAAYGNNIFASGITRTSASCVVKMHSWMLLNQVATDSCLKS